MRDDEIVITRPCPIDLREPVARAIASGRTGFHCSHCDRGVLVLSAMRESEASAALAGREAGELCVAYVRNREGQLRFQPEPALVPTKRLRARRALQASAVALGLGACTAHGDERVAAVDLEGLEVLAPVEPVEPALSWPPKTPIPPSDVVTGGEPPPPPEPIPRSKPRELPKFSTVVGGASLSGLPPQAMALGGLISPGSVAVKPKTLVKPVRHVMARAVYSPEPSAKRLAQTKAARFDRRGGVNVTSFCVDERGRVVKVKTKRRFPGDPQVDAIIRETIETWRFAPAEVGARPIETCTERTFKLKFE